MFLKKLMFVFLVILFFSCSKEEKKTSIACDGSNLTYNTGVSSIINNSCNSSNCHGSGSSHGSFTTYSGLQTVISSGSFNSSVLTNQNMPKGSSLTQNQLNELKCWVDNGYPEN